MAETKAEYLVRNYGGCGVFLCFAYGRHTDPRCEYYSSPEGEREIPYPTEYEVPGHRYCGPDCKAYRDAKAATIKDETLFFEDACQAVANELAALVIRKQHSYGHQNILAFGERGIVVRLNDKLARLRNLVWEHPERSQQVNETLDDTYADIAGYAIIALMLRNGTFTKELKVQ